MRTPGARVWPAKAGLYSVLGLRVSTGSPIAELSSFPLATAASGLPQALTTQSTERKQTVNFGIMIVGILENEII